MKTIRIISFYLLLFSSIPASAATYYVANSGSDTNPGSSELPFQTLQKAANTVAAGDTVLVADGQYAGMSLSESGTEAASIAFQATGKNTIINTPSSNGYGIHLNNVSYITIQNFTIENLPGMGIAHRGAEATAPVHGLIIRDNSIINCSGIGMYFSEVMDSLIENNEVDHCGWGSNTTHCVYMANAGTGGTTLRKNILHDCAVAGIHFNGDESIGGDGIISGMLVEQNSIYNNGQNGLNMDGVQDSIVRNNVIYNNSSNGIRAYAIDASEGPKNLIIVNNTIHIPPGGGWAVRITAELGGNTVFNNILLSEALGGSIAIDTDSVGFSSANNIVVNRFTADRDDTILNLTEWQALGYDANSFTGILADLFVDYPNGDYRLTETSAAIDSGTAAFSGHSAPLMDVMDETRPQGGGVDIGAYEFPVEETTPVLTPMMFLLLK